MLLNIPACSQARDRRVSDPTPLATFDKSERGRELQLIAYAKTLFVNQLAGHISGTRHAAGEDPFVLWNAFSVNSARGKIQLAERPRGSGQRLRR
jgi:hypothetical protein